MIPLGFSLNQHRRPDQAPFRFFFMKLQQNQTWQAGGEYLRIIHLNRKEVGYKSFLDPTSCDGTHHQISKKEFCRLVKGAVLLPPGRREDSPPR